MSALWVLCLCCAVWLRMDMEAAGIRPFPPLSARTSSVVNSLKLDNPTVQNHILSRKEGTKPLQDRKSRSLAEQNIQQTQKPLALNLEIIRNNTELMEWRSNILKGINILPKTGAPGRIIVFGANAEPILTGNTEEDVFIAAAEFDRGRIVAIAQECFSNNFSQNIVTKKNTMSVLNHNLKNWLTRGTFENNSIITNAMDRVDKKKLMLSKIVIYQGGRSNIPLSDLTEFVRNGGALLHCMTPWKWLTQKNKALTLSDAPYLALMTEAGLCYADGHINAPRRGFVVKDNKAKDAHMLRFLVAARKNVGQATENLEKLPILQSLLKSEFFPLRTIVKTLLKNCTVEIEKIGIPSPQKPVNSTSDGELLNLWLFYFNLLEPINIKAPGVNLFPGDFTNDPPLKNHTIEYHSDREDYHSTGCYLPAGQTLRVEVISGNNDKDWQLLIGSHTDVLIFENWRRWPNVFKKVQLTNTSLELSTAFGGLIYLISPNKPKLNIKVKLNNVVDSPQFRLTYDEKGKETWKKSRRSPGLWADIAGEFITITLPAVSVRNLEFEALKSVMKTWDYVVRLQNDLRGTSASNFRRQWIVTDEQPDVGWMHAGYPIVTHLVNGNASLGDLFLNNTHLIKYGDWGVFHEIGHNMQLDDWTFDGTGEVTCNIFTLYTMQYVCNLKPWIHSALMDSLEETEKFLKDGADFKSFEGNAVFMYAQLAHEFGWESYRKVFRRYQALNESERPRENQAKMDKWFITFSEVVEYNLAPLASFWNIPLCPKTVAHLQKVFPVGFLPDDEVTRFVPDRVNATLLKFPGTVRKRCLPV